MQHCAHSIMIKANHQRAIWLPLLLLVSAIAMLPTSSSFSTLMTKHASPFRVTSRSLPRQTAPTTTALAMTSSIWTTTMETIRLCSSKQQWTQAALSTPPVAYFSALMAAGCGVPVSEDGLCLFCGAIWSTSPNKVSLLTALYLGVVGSDAVTFWIGRALRLGLFQPIRDRLQLNQQEESKVHGSDSKRQDRLKGILASSGNRIGFVVRFCVGTRGPLMLLSGFSNQVSFVKFIIGSAVGACLSLPLQLYGGYVLGRDDPASVVRVVGIMSASVAAAALFVGVASWGALLGSQLQRRGMKENKSVL